MKCYAHKDMGGYAVSILFLLSMSCLDKNGVLKLPEEELSNAEHMNYNLKLHGWW